MICESIYPHLEKKFQDLQRNSLEFLPPSLFLEFL